MVSISCLAYTHPFSDTDTFGGSLISRTRIGCVGRRNVLATARETAGIRCGAQAVFVSVEEIGADVVVDVSAVGADIH